MLGVFDDVDALMAAIPKVRAKGLGRLEAYTPYPIHGIDEALGLRRSPLAGMVMVMGFLGACTALLFQWWMSAVDYPIITGGKAPFSWQAFVPIMFELTVLFATFTAGLGMLLLLNKLPFFGHPVLHSKAMEVITRDKFVLSVEAEKGSLDVEAARALLAASGARRHRGPAVARGLLSLHLAVHPQGRPGQSWWRASSPASPCTGPSSSSPCCRPWSTWRTRPRLDPQRADGFFKDGHGMQRPVAGTVARGYLPLGVASQEEAAALVNPLPRTSRRSWSRAGRGT